MKLPHLILPRPITYPLDLDPVVAYVVTFNINWSGGPPSTMTRVYLASDLDAAIERFESWDNATQRMKNRITDSQVLLVEEREDSERILRHSHIPPRSSGERR